MHAGELRLHDLEVVRDPARDTALRQHDEAHLVAGGCGRRRVHGDGQIDVADYGQIDFNAPLGTTGYFNGDFNYDGKTDVLDYGIIDFNVSTQGGPL